MAEETDGIVTPASNVTRVQKRRKSLPSVIRREGVDVVFQDLKYSVEGEMDHGEYKKLSYWGKFKESLAPSKQPRKFLLHGVDGIFRTGRFTAVMGASGAGKTTLINILASESITGVITGKILANGIRCDEKTSTSLRYISGFVFQDDVLLPTMTVREAIAMSAELRLPDALTDKERHKRVELLIKLLRLKHCENTLIGNTEKKGISGGERKRTSIAMELITNPSLLFLDEPTSGLDEFSAFALITYLVDLAHLGRRTIVATLHQPSSELYHKFDDLMLLSNGCIVYYGDAKEAVAYFSRLGYKCPSYTNPADWYFHEILRDMPALMADQENYMEAWSMLDAAYNARISRMSMGIEATEEDHAEEDLHQIEMELQVQEKENIRIQALINNWKLSPENIALIEELNGVEVRENVIIDEPERASYRRQFSFMFKRAFKNAYRNPLIYQVKLIQAIVVSVLVGLIFVNVNQYPVQQRSQNIAGVLFYLVVTQLFSSSTSAMSIFFAERPVFFREYSASYYVLPAYFVTKVLVELPGNIIAAYLLTIIVYYIVGLRSSFDVFLATGTIIMSVSVASVGIGIFVASIFPDLSVALVALPIILLPLLMFSGLFVNRDNIPGYLGWIQWISPSQYGFSGTMQLQFKDQTLPNCSAPENCDGNSILEIFSLENDLSWAITIIFIWAIFFGLMIVSYLSLWYQTRKQGQIAKYFRPNRSDKEKLEVE